MAKKIIKAQMKQRLDTSANWAATNPVLLSGELGIVSDDPNLYKIGDGVTHWNDLPFRGFDGTIVHETGQSRNAVMSQAGVTKALELAARFNPAGRYPDMSVGFADNLVGRGESIPAEFSFRATGGKSIQDGAARIKRVKGNSIVWNQMVDHSDVSANHAVITKSGNTITATLNADSISTGYAGIGYELKTPFIADHHYYVDFDALVADKSFSNIGIGNMIRADILTTSGRIIKEQIIVASGTSSPMMIYINAAGNLVSGASFSITGLKCVDLTRMYGAGNEPTTVEDFRSRMPIVADMNSYNEGEVLHMDVDAIKSVGDNAWDEEWENGGLDAENGSLYDTTAHFRNKGYIRVIPNTQYYFKKPIGIVTYLFFYDEDKNFVKWLDPFATAGEGGVFTTYNAPYMRFTCYMPTYNHDIMLTLVHSGWKQDTDAGYQPYWQDIKHLEVLRKYFPGGMRSAGAAYDEVRFNSASGKWEVVQRVGEVDMGSLAWEYGGSYFSVDQRYLPDMKLTSSNSINNVLTSAYLTSSFTNVANKDKVVMSSIFSNGIVCVKDSAYTDVASFKSAMAGVMLYYELAQPIVTEIAEDINLDYRVADFGTEEAVSSQPSAPFKADIIYQFNAVDMIREHEQEIAQLQAMISAMSAQLASLTNAN